MDKRLAKRHKRQVARARERVNISEPDLRTPEQIQAAREASQAVKTHNGGGSKGSAPVSTPRVSHSTGTGSAAKTSV